VAVLDARSWLFIASVVVHGGLALAVSAVRRPPRREVVAITIRASRAPSPPTPPPAHAAPAPIADAPTPASPRAPNAPRATQRAARSAPRSAPPPPAAPASTPSGGGAQDFGLSMSNGPSGGGLAVAGAGAGAGEGASPTPTRAAARQAQPAQDQACEEELTRARPVEIAQPEYPEAAREAAIEGRVRVEVTVDERGRVASARVIQALGHGCDEAALEVARAARFEAATRCGRPVRSTLTIGVRFTL